MEQSSLVGRPAAPAVPKPVSSGDGSAVDTILNVVNIAFGAGMLGLPYAIQGAGLVFGVFGLGAVLLWNFVCCWLLVELRNEVLRAREAAPAVRVSSQTTVVIPSQNHPAWSILVLATAMS